MQDWKAGVDWTFVPAHLRDPMTRYIDEGVNPGDFLQAFFSNDLSGALEHADFASRRRLFDISNFINSFVPGICHGSQNSFKEWIEAGGMQGVTALLKERAA